jgi:membrane protein DedA with SNARE-associated domain
VTRWAERIARPIAWMMRHFAEVTLFVLSAVPNPFYEVAGLSAGATRVHFLRFIIPTVAGKLVRGLLLAYIGARLGFL